MAATRGRKSRKGTFLFSIYAIIIVMAGAAVLLADAMSEQMDYNTDEIMIGGLVTIVGVFILVAIQLTSEIKRFDPEGRKGRAMRSGPAPAPGKKPAPKKQGAHKKTAPPAKKKTKAPVKKETGVKPTKATETKSVAVPKAKPSAYAAEIEALNQDKETGPRLYVYPQETPAGQYGDCFVPIGKNLVLKARTLLIETGGSAIVADDEGYSIGADDEYYEDEVEAGDYDAGETYDDQGEYSEEDYGDDAAYPEENYGDDEGEYSEDNYAEGDEEAAYEDEDTNYDDQGEYSEDDEEYTEV